MGSVCSQKHIFAEPQLRHQEVRRASTALPRGQIFAGGARPHEFPNNRIITQRGAGRVPMTKSSSRGVGRVPHDKEFVTRGGTRPQMFSSSLIRKRGAGRVPHDKEFVARGGTRPLRYSRFM